MVQWLRDGLKIIRDASETHGLAEAADETENVILVPAFTGLGAPYWNAECRGAIFGLTRNTGPAEIAKAALNSVAFQTHDLIEAISEDWTDSALSVLRVDGGMTNNDWMMQVLADQLSIPIDRPQNTETTALGVAYLAGLRAGLCPPPAEFSRQWALETRFTPKISVEVATMQHAEWKSAVQKLIS